MAFHWVLVALFACFLSAVAPVQAQIMPSSTMAATSFKYGSSTVGSSTATSTASASTSGPPDVVLYVPTLSVGRIELDVEDLSADINLNANVASLVSINAGVAVSISKVNITIVDVEAELELIVRLGHLVDIVNRVFESLDLNPLLITALNDVTSVLNTTVAAVDGLLGSVTQGDSTLSFIVDNLGNIVQEVAGSNGSIVSTIVGDYLTNMTYTGTSKSLSNDLTEKVYSYTPLNALVDIVFNAAGQIVQATVQKSGSSSSSTSSGTSSTSVPTASASGTTT